jgi:hypothetical protein
LCEKNFVGDITEYPNIYKKLIRYKDKLTSRREVKKGARRWYDLWWPRNEFFFKQGDKIICATRTIKPSCTFTNDEFYCSRALNIIKTDRINLKYLTVILNSNVSYFWLKYMGKHTGNLLQIDKSQLLSIPIIKIPENEQIPFIEKADKMIELNKKFLNKKNEFLKSLNLTKITKKLETFYNLSYKELLKELKKQKINSTDDLENRFNNYKKELNEIKQEIEKTDKEIDKMVYKLYNLTGEEIKIIENMN